MSMLLTIGATLRSSRFGAPRSRPRLETAAVAAYARAVIRLRRVAAIVAGAALVTPAAGLGTGSSSIRLDLSPPLALRDVPLSVRVSGLRPHERVTIRAEERSTQGRLWRSSESADAGADGVVVLPRTSLDGLMSPVNGDPEGDAFPRPRSTIRVDVLDGGRVLATATAVRVLRPGNVRVELVRPKVARIYGDFFVSARRSTGAPVLIMGGSEGGLSPSVLAPARLLAAHGHPTLAIAYFGEPGLPAQLRNIPLEYFRRALEWLRAQPQVRGRRVVVAGGSYGGEAVLLIGATYPTLVRGVVALVPDDWVDPSPGIGSYAAWTLHGKAVPIGQIPVRRIRGPIFAVGGGDDQLWPSAAHVESLRRDLGGHGSRPTLLVYPRAGHGVGTIVPYVPTFMRIHSRYGILDLGGTRAADEHAREDAWPRLLAWLASLSRGR
jgi:dienelactone hydrolase